MRKRFQSLAICDREPEPAEKIISALGCMLARQQQLNNLKGGTLDEKLFQSVIEPVTRALQCDSVLGSDLEEAQDWHLAGSGALSSQLRLLQNQQHECANMFTSSGSPMTGLIAERTSVRINDMRRDQQPKWFREWYVVFERGVREYESFSQCMSIISPFSCHHENSTQITTTLKSQKCYITRKSLEHQRSNRILEHQRSNRTLEHQPSNRILEHQRSNRILEHQRSNRILEHQHSNTGT